MWWRGDRGECVVNGRLFQVRQLMADDLYSVLFQNQAVCFSVGDPFNFVAPLVPWQGRVPGDTVQEVRQRFLCNDNR